MDEYDSLCFNGLVEDCSISSALAMEILQCGTKLTICWTDFVVIVIARSELDDNAKVHRSLDKAQLFAYHLEQNWNLGGCDEDIIILFSREDNVVCVFFVFF